MLQSMALQTVGHNGTTELPDCLEKEAPVTQPLRDQILFQRALWGPPPSGPCAHPPRIAPPCWDSAPLPGAQAPHGPSPCPGLQGAPLQPLFPARLGLHSNCTLFSLEAGGHYASKTM